MELYQSLVTVNPVTLIAQICNLFLQLAIVKIFFLDKIRAILDQRREAADRDITDAQAVRAEALVIRETYEQNMKDAKAQANSILERAQKSATIHSEEIVRRANAEAAAIRAKASTDIAREKKKAINDAKNEIAGISLAIAGKVVGCKLNESSQNDLIDRFIDELGENI